MRKEKEEEAAKLRDELKTVVDEEKMKEIMATELEPVHE